MVRTLKSDEKARAREAAIARAEQEIQTILETLPPEALKPEKLEAIRRRRDEQLNKQRARTLEIIEEWRDETVREKEIGEIVEHLRDYGFPDSFLSHVTDPLTLRYIRENHLRDQRIKKFLAKVQEAKPQPIAKGGKQERAQKRSAPAPVSRTDHQVRGFMSLIEKAAGD